MQNALNEKCKLNLISPQQITAAATVTANLDCLGARYAVIRMNFSSEATTNAAGPTLALTECDTTVASSFATFDANFARSAEDLTAAKGLKYCVDLLGRKRYLRLAITAGTHTSGDIYTICADASLTRLEEGPSSTTEMLVSTSDIVVVG
jgi:hypothetical protein